MGERVRDAYSLLEKRLDQSVARVSALEDELGRERDLSRDLQVSHKIKICCTHL